MTNGPMKIMALKILGVLANNKEKLFTDIEIVEELRKLGVTNEILAKRTITIIANKKWKVRYEDKHKSNRFYSFVPTQKQLNEYF